LAEAGELLRTSLAAQRLLDSLLAAVAHLLELDGLLQLAGQLVAPVPATCQNLNFCNR
jgi:hypothetical protein